MRRFGIVEIELFKASDFFQFFAKGKTKQHWYKTSATDESQSSLHLLFTVG